MNATTPNFYDTLFNKKKVVHPPAYQGLLPIEQWNCKVGIFSNVSVVHGGENEKLLQGIMAACKLTPNDWKVFPKGCHYQSILNLNEIRYLLLFGCSEKEINVHIQLPMYKPCSLHGKIWLKAHSLEVLQKESGFKKALWNQGLKPLFSK